MTEQQVAEAMPVARFLAALMTIAAANAANAAEPAPLTAAQVSGKTLSAVAYVSQPAGAAGGGLYRIALQAYLAPDGSGVFRQWLAARNRYSVALRIRWSLSASRLCLDFPADPPLCAKVHIWAQRIAGIGAQPYVMLDGDLRPGNAIAAQR